MVYIGSGARRRPFLHLDASTVDDKVAMAIQTARRNNVHVMFKIMYMKNMKAARHSEAMLLRHYRNQQQFLFNDLYKRTNMTGVESLVGQLVKPTLGCQLWLDASARRPPGYFLVLPQELQQATSRYNSEKMPIGWHKVIILYSKYKSDAEMDKMRKMQKCVPPHLLLKLEMGSRSWYALRTSR